MIIRYLASLLIAFGLSSAYLLDGPSEIESVQDVAAELNAIYVATNEVNK